MNVEFATNNGMETVEMRYYRTGTPQKGIQVVLGNPLQDKTDSNYKPWLGIYIFKTTTDKNVDRLVQEAVEKARKLYHASETPFKVETVRQIK